MLRVIQQGQLIARYRSAFKRGHLTKQHGFRQQHVKYQVRCMASTQASVVDCDQKKEQGSEVDEAKLQFLEQLKQDVPEMWSTGLIRQSLYSDNVYFKDPITEFSSFQLYVLTVNALRLALQPKFNVHDWRFTGEMEITAWWTISFKARLPWQPRLSVTGQSLYTIEKKDSNYIVSKHVEYWDSLPKTSDQLLLQATLDVVQQTLPRYLQPDLESPNYTVLKRTDEYELRQYDSYTVAEVPQKGSMTSGNGFNQLAGYIFGGNDKKKSMKMTTPVYTTREGDTTPPPTQPTPPSPAASSPPTVPESTPAATAAQPSVGETTSSVTKEQSDTSASGEVPSGSAGSTVDLEPESGEAVVGPPGAAKGAVESEEEEESQGVDGVSGRSGEEGQGVAVEGSADSEVVGAAVKVGDDVEGQGDDREEGSDVESVSDKEAKVVKGVEEEGEGGESVVGQTGTGVGDAESTASSSTEKEPGFENRMQFVMETQYGSDIEKLPVPNDPSVQRKVEAGGLWAAKVFSGWPVDSEVTQAEKELRNALRNDGLTAKDDYKLARYNEPYVPPFLRRNEVLIEVSGDWQ